MSLVHACTQQTHACVHGYNHGAVVLPAPMQITMRFLVTTLQPGAGSG